jgi:4-hydroxy-4-methyl-2-oxoglutarate aldolase
MHKVIATIERPPKELVERFRPLAFALIAEHLGRSQVMDPAIKPLQGRDWFICGPAVTVKLEHIDILMGMAAAAVAQPGDVIVVDAQGHTESAVWGGSMTRSALNVGCEAVVVDGAIQDTRTLLSLDFPVFCRGAHPHHGTLDKPGSVNVPVSCGGVTVYPGDIVIGNLDGVIVIPRADAAAIIEPAEAATAKTRAGITTQMANKTTFFDQRNGRELLRQAGVEWID